MISKSKLKEELRCCPNCGHGNVGVCPINTTKWSGIHQDPIQLSKEYICHDCFTSWIVYFDLSKIVINKKQEKK